MLASVTACSSGVVDRGGGAAVASDAVIGRMSVCHPHRHRQCHAITFTCLQL
jgi:hypothetical protein